MSILSAGVEFVPAQPLLLHWLRAAEYELMLFAGFWFVLGILDELAVDIVWLWLRVVKRMRTHDVPDAVMGRPLLGQAAVMIPTWQESEVIGATIGHILRAWPQEQLRLYIGCYSDDAPTILAAMAAIGGDSRARVVVHGLAGPTTKADCLNRLYTAMCHDEKRGGVRVRSVILHDAEDMVHPAALPLMDAALTDADLVQLPVRPEPHPRGRWIAGHYCDEFTEAHAKAMVVRDALGAAMPAAGVGCALSRNVVSMLAKRRRSEGKTGPFETTCLTEDYELGWLVAQHGGTSRFLRLRDSSGMLVSTRSYFPATMASAVRQKTRWVHGIAFQGWENLGWWGRPVDLWMALRDRRGPLVALVLAVAYALLVLSPMLMLAEHFGLVAPRVASPMLDVIAPLCLAGLLWRTALRFAFTTREYGLVEGVRAVLRIPLANLIAIISGRRALVAYCRTLLGGAVTWDKTAHRGHPSQTVMSELPV
ncbi:MAG: glycosyl transferase family protein [Novosphingobium sp.]